MPNAPAVANRTGERRRRSRPWLRRCAVAAVLAVLNWALDAVCLWLCFRAVSDEPVDVTQVLLAFCAGMAAGTLTIVPGSLGIIDNALILGLVTGGAATATAIAAVVLYRVITFGFLISVGWITWLVLDRRGPSAPETPVHSSGC